MADQQGCGAELASYLASTVCSGQDPPDLRPSLTRLCVYLHRHHQHDMRGTGQQGASESSVPHAAELQNQQGLLEKTFRLFKKVGCVSLPA